MLRLAGIAILMATLGASVLAQTTKPASAETIAAMELRAQTAFDKGDYATALPLFMNAEKKLIEGGAKPERLGPLQEKIRVCKKNLLKDPPKDLQNFQNQTPAADTTSPEKRKPHVVPKDGKALELAIKDLGNFEYDAEKPPQVQHTIVVHTPKGKAVGYFPDEIVVEGTLVVNEKKEDGLIISVFEVNCTSVKPMAK